MLHVSAASLWAIQLLLTLGEALVLNIGVLYVGGLLCVCKRPFEGVGLALWAAAC
jgi:hypothetical protein